MKYHISVSIDPVGDEQRRWLRDRLQAAADEWALADIIQGLAVDVAPDASGDVAITFAGEVADHRAGEALALVDELLDRTGLFQRRDLTEDRWSAIVTSRAAGA